MQGYATMIRFSSFLVVVHCNLSSAEADGATPSSSIQWGLVGNCVMLLQRRPFNTNTHTHQHAIYWDGDGGES